LLEGRVISIEAQEDGVAEIDGSFIVADAAERRLRFLTPSNLLIAPQGSPLNNSQEDLTIQKWMDVLLQDSSRVHEFVDRYFRKLPRVHF